MTKRELLSALEGARDDATVWIHDSEHGECVLCTVEVREPGSEEDDPGEVILK